MCSSTQVVPTRPLKMQYEYSTFLVAKFTAINFSAHSWSINTKNIIRNRPVFNSLFLGCLFLESYSLYILSTVFIFSVVFLKTIKKILRTSKPKSNFDNRCWEASFSLLNGCRNFQFIQVIAPTTNKGKQKIFQSCICKSIYLHPKKYLVIWWYETFRPKF